MLHFNQHIKFLFIFIEKLACHNWPSMLCNGMPVAQQAVCFCPKQSMHLKEEKTRVNVFMKLLSSCCKLTVDIAMHKITGQQKKRLTEFKSIMQLFYFINTIKKKMENWSADSTTKCYLSWCQLPAVYEIKWFMQKNS